jgi:hypothetical protein
MNILRWLFGTRPRKPTKPALMTIGDWIENEAILQTTYYNQKLSVPAKGRTDSWISQQIRRQGN